MLRRVSLLKGDPEREWSQLRFADLCRMCVGVCVSPLSGCAALSLSSDCQTRLQRCLATAQYSRLMREIDEGVFLNPRIPESPRQCFTTYSSNLFWKSDSCFSPPPSFLVAVGEIQAVERKEVIMRLQLRFPAGKYDAELLPLPSLHFKHVWHRVIRSILLQLVVFFH